MAAAFIVGAGAIVACRPSGEIGYVEIKTVPTTLVSPSALFLDTTKLTTIKGGSAILRQGVGTVRLQAEGFAGALVPLCSIIVAKDRITTVTVSVLERPPRCQCRFTGNDAAHAHDCVS